MSGGSGPTDPDEIISAMRDGAQLVDSHLRLRDGSDRWLAVIEVDGRRRWVLTVTRGVGISDETVRRIGRARQMPDGRLMVTSSLGALAYTLEPPLPDAADQLAYLAPA